MENELMQDLKSNKNTHILQYSSNEDIYIRNNVSTILGKFIVTRTFLKKK